MNPNTHMNPCQQPAKAIGHTSLGFGLGLRPPYHEHLLHHTPRSVDWLEVLSDNYLHAHGGHWQLLLDLRQHYPMALHGVSLSIGGHDPLNMPYIQRLRLLADTVEATWVSDHLCFTGHGGHYSFDLLPLVLSPQTLNHVASRVQHVQDVLKRPLVLENASSYLEWQSSTLSEPEFLNELHHKTGCLLLLDVNNVVVSCTNHGWDIASYIKTIPSQAIVQYHLAGHTRTMLDDHPHCIDTHNTPICDEVLHWFGKTVAQHGMRSTLIEWDADYPSFETLEAELFKAKTAANKATLPAHPSPVACQVAPHGLNHAQPSTR